MSDPQRLAAQIAFIAELDKLKTVLRQTPLIDGSRRETDAEHSWHAAMMALLLAEHADEAINPLRAAKMLLIHDVVEIDAGDTFIYDTVAQADQGAREQKAADRLFGMLPADQEAELRALWDEFEAKDTADARYAGAIDRFAPMLNNHLSGGLGWKANKVRPEQVFALNAPRIGAASASLWDYAKRMVEASVARGDFPEVTP
jgi:putative hydrolase of HD superfamily